MTFLLFLKIAYFVALTAFVSFMVWPFDDEKWMIPCGVLACFGFSFVDEDALEQMLGFYWPIGFMSYVTAIGIAGAIAINFS